MVNLELVFGYHFKPGTGPLDCKWKMYMELDGDEVAIAYIKDVTFNANRPDVEVLKMTKPPFVMDKWIVGLQDNSVMDCVVNYESDVRSPRSTRHTHTVVWNSTSGHDEIKTMELVIETAQSNIEGHPRSRSNSDVDPKWMYKLRQRQLKSQSAQKPVARSSSSSSDPHPLHHFLSDQASSYAAALRRSPNRSPLSVWSDSRSSSPTASISTKLSSFQLGSKGSSPSSTTSESASERDRPLSAGAVHNYRRPSYFGNTLTVKGPDYRDLRTHTRDNFTPNRSSRTPHHSGRPRSNSYSSAPQNSPRLIPGISAEVVSPTAERGEAKVSEGGWIKVERSKKLPRQENKQVRGRQRRGGRGRGRS